MFYLACWFPLVWKAVFPICFPSQTTPVMNRMAMWFTHYLGTLFFQVLTIVIDPLTRMATVATSASQCQTSSGCVAAPMEWAWLPITWRAWKTRLTNHPWRSVAPFPSHVPTADVCPVTTTVTESMTATITAMSTYVAHLVSHRYIGDTFWDEQREVG